MPALSGGASYHLLGCRHKDRRGLCPLGLSTVPAPSDFLWPVQTQWLCAKGLQKESVLLSTQWPLLMSLGFAFPAELV